MGKTVRTITDAYDHELSLLSNFRRGLRRSDQLIFDQLAVFSRKHLAAASLAADALPMEMFLLTMNIEQQKEIQRLNNRIELLEHMLKALSGIS